MSRCLQRHGLLEAEHDDSVDAAWDDDPMPPPRAHLMRYHGVFAPNSRDRARITPARRGKGTPPQTPEQVAERTPAEQRAAMRWAQRLQRVFKLDVQTCPGCGGAVKLIACIEAPAVIARIFAVCRFRL